MGQVALPELRRFNYSGALATGSLAAGGTLGILIPPSVVLIIYAVMVEANMAIYDYLAHVPVVEGAGGVMVPLNEEHTMLDLMRRLALPVLVVGRNALGTINHTLLTVEQLRRHGLEILGVVLNGGRNADHREAVERYAGVEVLGEVGRFVQIGPAEVRRVFERDLGGRHG